MPVTCPSCGRPAAVARASCVYCGAPLGEAPPAPVAAPPRSNTAAPEPERSWIVLWASEAEPTVLAAALETGAYEAGQRARRGGWQLVRAIEPAAAEAACARLEAMGLEVLAVPGAEVRQALSPLVITGGGRGAQGLDLHDADGRQHRLQPGDVLLVVVGPIARQYQAAERARRIRSARPNDTLRFHLHLRTEARPLELDPESFDFGAAVRTSASSELELRSWVEAIRGEAEVDDRFRFEPPALAPAAPATGLAAAAQALTSGGPEGPRGTRAPVLDNLTQFRVYSGWRAAVARRR